MPPGLANGLPTQASQTAQDKIAQLFAGLQPKPAGGVQPTGQPQSELGRLMAPVGRLG